MVDAVTPDQVAEAVLRWFGEVGGASLKLPSGWFGRPFDNLHRLTEASVNEGRDLLLVLDETQRLSVRAPLSVRVQPNTLTIKASTSIEWRWVEYGSDTPHIETFTGGDVEFHAG